MDLNNKKKRYFCLDNRSSGDVFVILNLIDIDAEDDIDDLMNDSGTEFISHADMLQGGDTNEHHIALSIPSENIHQHYTSDEREENIDLIAKSES